MKPMNASPGSLLRATFLTVLLSTACAAAPSGTGTEESPFRRGGPVGIGVIVGEPTGLSAEKWIAPRRSVDFAAAWSLRNDGNLHVHADHLWHDFGVFRVDRGTMALHYGVGGSMAARNGEGAFGLRLPVGITYLFRGGHTAMFVELAPGIGVIPDTDFELHGGIGARYFFR
jgi:hypothetical protein